MESDTEGHGSDIFVIFVYSPFNNGGDSWPKGAFRVEIFVDDRTDPDQIIDFEAEQDGRKKDFRGVPRKSFFSRLR